MTDDAVVDTTTTTTTAASPPAGGVTDARATDKDGSTTFAVTRDRILQLCACNEHVEQAVYALDEAHVRHIAALRREFAADTARRSAAQRHDAAERERAAALARERAVAQLTQQYEQQLQKMTAAHLAEMARLRASVAALREPREHADGVVAELHRSHASELTRVRDEAARALSVKDAELASLRRQLHEEAAARASDGDAAVQRVRAAEATAAQLRRELLDARAQHNAVEARCCDELVRFIDAQQAALRAGSMLLASLRDAAAVLQRSRGTASTLLRQLDDNNDGDADDEGKATVVDYSYGEAAKKDAGAARRSVRGVTTAHDGVVGDDEHNGSGDAAAAMTRLLLRMSTLQARRQRERALMQSIVQQLHDVDDELERVTRAHDEQVAAHTAALRTLACTACRRDGSNTATSSSTRRTYDRDDCSSSSGSSSRSRAASQDQLAAALRTSLALLTHDHV